MIGNKTAAALYRGTSLEDWLVDEFLVLGLFPFQNWMWLGIAIAAVSVAVSAWWVRH